MNARYIDTHCHIQFEDFDDNRDEIIEEMKRDGIIGILVGVDKDSSEKAILLAEKHEHLYATVGLHPNYTKENIWERDVFKALAVHPKVVAIGECGIDYFRPEPEDVSAPTRQQAVFRAQCALAEEVGKPLMVHARPTKGTQDAYHDVADILEEFPKVRANMHFFVGGVEEVARLTLLNSTFSYPGIVTFTRDYDSSIFAIPDGSIMTETDSPYASPASKRGKKNDPRSIPEILETLATVRKVPVETLEKQVLKTAQDIFGIAIGETL